MIKEIKGQLSAGQGKYAIVVSRFNEFITSKLLGGAIDCLLRHGAKDEQVEVVWVPGHRNNSSGQKTGTIGKYAAVICLGAVIRGSTSHYDYVCQQVSRGVGQINYETGVPTIFGVLTCETIEQAIERAGTKAGNAGVSAAMSAMEMADVLKQI